MNRKGVRVVLASRSPRRKELLSRLIDEFEIITLDTDETLPHELSCREGVEVIACRKGEAVAAALPTDVLVISSDTLVELDGIPLGKPRSAEDALSMLMRLSGRTHNVHTGIAVHYKGRRYSGCDTAHVRFKKFDTAAAREYVNTGEPMDKAGSYAIQGVGAALVDSYEGSFEAIVGLGLELAERLIEEALSND